MSQQVTAGSPTINYAKSLVSDWLQEWSLPAYKLTAKTVSFSDLGRGSCVFVVIHGWQPDPAWSYIKSRAHSYGFCVEAI